MKKLKYKDKSSYGAAAPSTLCVGCGHDQVSKHIIKAFQEAEVDPFNIAKISGIGCSSKTPNYFLKNARGFNTIHGRMASVATGVKLANRDLKVIGISGDGDTGSIGLGSFLHTIKKNIPMIYIVENNGVYGLTKGQFSSTAEKSDHLKSKGENPFYPMDLCLLALSAGCSFIARTFSGDNLQMKKILKLALIYEGFAFIDIISPCVAYGNEKDFNHSFSFMKERRVSLHDLDIILEQKAVEQEILEGEIQKIPLSQGHTLLLKKLKNHDPTQKNQAWKLMEEARRAGETVTGLIYYRSQDHFLDTVNLSRKPLVSLKEKEIKIPSKKLQDILQNYK